MALNDTRRVAVSALRPTGSARVTSTSRDTVAAEWTIHAERTIEGRIRARVLDLVLEQHRNLWHRCHRTANFAERGVGVTMHDRPGANRDRHAANAQADLDTGIAQPIFAGHHLREWLGERVAIQRTTEPPRPVMTLPRYVSACRALLSGGIVRPCFDAIPSWPTSETPSIADRRLALIVDRDVTGAVSRNATSSRGAVASIADARGIDQRFARALLVIAIASAKSPIAASHVTVCARSHRASRTSRRSPRGSPTARTRPAARPSASDRSESNRVTLACARRQRIERDARRVGERHRLESRPRRIDTVEECRSPRFRIRHARRLELHAGVSRPALRQRTLPLRAMLRTTDRRDLGIALAKQLVELARR